MLFFSHWWSFPCLAEIIGCIIAKSLALQRRTQATSDMARGNRTYGALKW
jgi:hypothetical protein